MKKEDNKIIPFPQLKNDKEPIAEHKKKKDWTLLVALLGVLVAVIGIIVDIALDKKEELQNKPLMDIGVKYYEKEFYGDVYLGEQGTYISELSINAGDGGVEQVNVSVEPFFNIIYYNQRHGTLVKQLLPINDLKDVSVLYAPLEINILNMKSNDICEIKLNENTYRIVYNMVNLFKDSNEINYNDYLSNIFGDMIIASIDFEFYITIDYVDVYGNDYTEIYLCETGFKDFSGYLTDFCFEADETKLSEDIIEYNIKCCVEYAALKAHHLENMEFDAKISRISDEDVFYKEFHKLYSERYYTSGNIMYVPNISEDLDVLISDGYDKKQLIFILDDDKNEWYMQK